MSDFSAAPIFRRVEHLSAKSSASSSPGTSATANTTTTAAPSTLSSSLAGVTTPQPHDNHANFNSTVEAATEAAASASNSSASSTAATSTLVEGGLGGPDLGRQHFLGHPDLLYLGCLFTGALLLLASRRFPALFTTAGALVAGVWVGLLFQDLQDHRNTASDEWWLPMFLSISVFVVLMVVLHKWSFAGIGALSSMMAMVQILALLRLFQVNIEREVFGKVYDAPFLEFGVFIYAFLILLTVVNILAARYGFKHVLVHVTSVLLANLLLTSSLSYFLQRAINANEDERLRQRRGFSLLDDLARVTSQVRYGQCGGHFERETARENGVWEKGTCDCAAGCCLEILTWFFASAGVFFLRRKMGLRSVEKAKEERAPLREMGEMSGVGIGAGGGGPDVAQNPGAVGLSPGGVGFDMPIGKPSPEPDSYGGGTTAVAQSSGRNRV
mmetsp:Transcript_18642/g.46537  ORF Transcript_18642/g.46537 Transcript_18642/m.46537 type:complete len:442 (+) Transcript_18642:84-1409(+)